MSRFSDAKRSGYVTLLAVTFAFGLAALGTALAVSARSYLASVSLRERAILDRISLESATAVALANMATRRERPLRALQLTPVNINGRVIATELSIPETKVDLAMDDEDVIRKAVGRVEGRQWNRLPKPGFGISAWARAVGLSSAEEDCLRHRVTFGRAPETFAVHLALPNAPRTIRLESGDQVDVRAALKKGREAQVLWVRARFISPQAAWSLHEYRRISGDLSSECSLGAVPAIEWD